MPETIQAYIETVEAQIRWKRARGVVSLELRRHLEDQRDAFAAEGREDAERLAVEEMGDPVSVGTELDRLHRPRPQWGLLGLTVALACVGALLRVQLTRGDGLDAVSPAMAALALALGTAAMLGAYFLDVSFLARCPRAVYLGALAAGALAMWLSPEIHYASYYTRYVVLFYPVVYALWLYSCRGSGWRHFALAVAGGIPLAAICLLAPFLSGLVLLLVCGLVLLLCAIRMGWFGPGRWRFAGAALALAAGMPALFFGMGYGQYFLDRLRLALHPETDPLGRGYWGWMTKRYLREVPFIQRNGRPVIELADQECLPLKLLVRWGWLAGLLLMAAITALLVWLLARCLRQRQQLGRLIALAVVLSLGLETLFSAALNLGYVFFSAHLPLVVGNLHTVIDMALIGLALSVFRGGGILRDEPAGEARRPVFPWRVKISIISTKET
nr:permease prefix domain 1-containing protein [uncultured Oscillibacter sp.]